jgi:pteridine reductase
MRIDGGMKLESASRVALVTGGAKRVGRAIVLRLAQEGFDVAFTYLHSDADAKGLVNEVRLKGRQCLAIAADLTDPAKAVDAVYKQFTTTHEQLDVLVNNASLYEPSAMHETDLQQLRRLWAIHIESPLMLCRVFGPMLRASRGNVINMLDLLVEHPRADYLGYCASKGGLWTLTLGLARELAPEVTVNGIAPGVVEWPVDLPQEERDNYLRRVPLDRPGTPNDVAEAVLYLCTGGQYVSGQVLRLDGGRSLT